MDVDRHDGLVEREGEARGRVDRAGDGAVHGTSSASSSSSSYLLTLPAPPAPYSLFSIPRLTLTHTQLDKVRQGQFYVLVPDNETRHEVDQLRIMWAAGDVAEGRPALSRGHKDYKALFEEYIRDGLAQLE